MKEDLKGYWGLIKGTARAWQKDQAQRLGAALAYYTVLALPPLFVILFFFAGLLFDAASARFEIFCQVTALIGDEGSKQLQSLIATPQAQSKGLIASAIAIGTLLLT